MDAMSKLCRQRYEEFGAAGQASKIKPVPVSVMARRYASGDLNPRFGVSRDAAE
jgi:fructose-bisphosphate aldolase, class II